ncbi:hypothetical protein K2173_007365 [Erythroxylum novogranatense]|uniref:Uncharacterized protein n=1 Tax=Erythroxylum novogranatense TaxID=1862640 RepID=A0AAV8T7Z9_9ROSI|nr:hypothetical protein K2173_007365 [Erythroxylum novogranatense]
MTEAIKVMGRARGPTGNKFVRWQLSHSTCLAASLEDIVRFVQGDWNTVKNIAWHSVSVTKAILELFSITR